MKKGYRYLLVSVLSASIMAISAFAGSAYTKQATLNYRGITICVNGEKQTLADANGNVVEPFIIDGTTYLPVRAVSQALGMDVAWDDATSTITIGAAAPTPTPSPAPLNTTQQSDLINRLDLCIKSAGYQADAAQNAIDGAISRGMARSSYVDGYRAKLAAAQSDIANMQALKVAIANATTNDELSEYAREVANYEAVY